MPFEYIVKSVDRIVDGDTLHLTADLGFKTFKKFTTRLNGINTPETRTRDLDEKERGLAAKQFVIDWFDIHQHFQLIVRVYMQGKYGRWIADIYAVSDKESHSLCEDLLANGHAEKVEY